MILASTLVIVSFCIGAWVLPILLISILRLIFKGPINVVVFVWMACIGSGYALLDVSAHLLKRNGYHLSWWVIGILAAFHLFWGSQKTANQMNQAQGFGTLTGIIVFAIIWIFR
jgi:hypothetical protein